MKSRLVSMLLATLSVWLGAASFVSAADPVIAPVLQPFVDGRTLAGAVTLVADSEKVLDVETVGYADIAAKKPMAPDTVVWIASMTKPITATALMLLVDEGKVNLDDPVEKYLPEFRGQMVIAEKTDAQLVLKKPTRPVSVRDVLRHTGGLVSNSPIEPKLDAVPLREATLVYGLSPIKFDPGAKYEYNNPGINTAGRIIEVVSGRPYDVFLQQRLLDPLGMTDTSFILSDDQAERLAKSYKPNAEKKDLEETTVTYLTYPLTDPRRFAFPGGGLFSTAEDLSKFCRMILNGGVHEGKRLLSEQAVREMTSTQTGDLLNEGKSESGYGLGWQTHKKSSGESGPAVAGKCGHGGAYSTNMTIDPEHGLVLIYLVQHAGYANDDGGKILPAFQQAAVNAFSKSQPKAAESK
ncbi:MAG TPA: serine hydrolase domain-containing protein [Pirellulales bacterium]